MSVFGEPPGLDVDAPGASIGKTPVVDLKVEPGRHVIRLKDAQIEIDAEPGKSIKLNGLKGAFIKFQLKSNIPEYSEVKRKMGHLK